MYLFGEKSEAEEGREGDNMCACTMVHMWTSKKNLQESILSFYHADPRDPKIPENQSQTARSVAKLYPLRRLASLYNLKKSHNATKHIILFIRRD